MAANKSKSLARRIKKCESRLRSGEVVVRRIESSDHLEDAMRCFHVLHQSRRDSIGDGSCFDDPRFEPFLLSAFASLMDQRKARFVVCESAGIPIGIHLQLKSMHEHQVYQTGNAPEAMKLEPGHVLITDSIRTAIEEGAKTFDFLRGDEPYKAYWGATPQPLVTECITTPSWKAQAFDGVYQTLKWLKSASGWSHGQTACR